MHKRATSVIGAVVAACGFGLASIPTASAARSGHATSGCTSTTYSEYTQYCEGTTTTQPGTQSTVTTSSNTTPLTTAAGTTTGAAAGSTTTGVDASPDVDSTGNVIVHSFTASKSLKVGTVLEPGVTVIADHDGALVIDDHGYDMKVPKGAKVSLAADGTMFVATTGKGAGSDRVHIVGGKVSSAFLRTELGVSFGYSHAPSSILKQVFVQNGTKVDGATITKISKPHGRIWISLATATANPDLTTFSKVFEFTRAKAAYVKAHHSKTTTVLIVLTTTTGKTYTARFVVPITEVTVVPFD